MYPRLPAGLRGRRVNAGGIEKDRAAASAARTVRDSRSHRRWASRLSFESLPEVEAMCGPHARAAEA